MNFHFLWKLRGVPMMGMLSSLSSGGGRELGVDRARVLREAQHDELRRFRRRQTDASDELARRDHGGCVERVAEIDEVRLLWIGRRKRAVLELNEQERIDRPRARRAQRFGVVLVLRE